MTIKFFGAFRGIAGEKVITIDLVPDIKALITFLTELYGEEMGNRLINNGELRKDIIILRNGNHISRKDILDQTLLEEDIISFFPAIVGG